MTSLIIQRCVVTMYILMTTSATGWMKSPMSWSPDGEWLGYTVVADPAREGPRPGWLFDADPRSVSTRRAEEIGDDKTSAPAMIYQIWASHRNHEHSVLVEQARWPLTAPCWSPRGKAIAFGRFVPRSVEPNQPIQRGRFEITIQDAMNRKKVLWTSVDFDLDEKTRALVPHLSLAWSPDGRYLAFCPPGAQPSILIVRPDSGRVLATLENATQPAWSPDGSKFAFIRDTNEIDNIGLVERHGQTFGPSKQFVGNGSLRALPGWSSDSQSMFVVAEKTTARSRELVLDRVSPKGGDSGRVFSLVAEPALRVGAVLGGVLDFDRDGERCFFSVDIAGRENELGVGILRDQNVKRFHPIDNGLRIGAIAVSPDDRYLAIRFGSPGSLSPPALYDLALEQLTLIVPDETSRRQWLNTLIDASRRLLLSALPPVTADGHIGERPTLLPLPGELASTEAVRLRLARIARIAFPLCDLTSQPRNAQARTGADGLAIEAHLFFAYLLDDFTSAASDLDALDLRITSPDDRLALLSLRAQVLWSRGQHSRAQAMIDYLVAIGGAYTKRVEDTPSGSTVTVEATSKQGWSRYLSARAADGASTPSHARPDMPGELIDIPLQNPFAPPEPPQFDRAAGNAPFAPIFPGLEGMRDIRRIVQPDGPDFFRPIVPLPALDGPAPRFFP